MDNRTTTERTPQQPLDSGFDGATTAADVIKGIDLSGKVAIVTGGYAGIGIPTTSALLSAGAKVIVPARDMEKARIGLKGLDNVELWPMDLADPASIDTFAARFLATGQPLHILINNAGVMALPLTRDARGYETQFATNHLGHYQLAVKLWPALRKAKGARIISLSSLGHRYSPVIFEDLHYEHREYDRWKAYGQSKTANILFAVEADRRGKVDGIRAFAVHPGSIVSTDLKRYMSEEELRSVGVLDDRGNPILDPSRQFKTAEQGAATSIWCATSPQLNGMGAVYCENCDISPETSYDAQQGGNDLSQRKASKAFGVFAYATDGANAEKLWLISGQLTGAKL